MKIFIILFITFSSLFSYTIEFKKSFFATIKPDTLQTNLNINVKKQTEKDIISALSKLSKKMEKFKDLEIRGGNYSINVNYSYEKNKRYKNGYTGYMSYTISSKESEKMEKFIADFINDKKDSDIDINIGSINWIISDKLTESKLDELRLQAIKWSKDYAKTLSKELNQTCKQSKISFDNSYNPPAPPIVRGATIAMDEVAPSPKRSSQKISLYPYITVECK
jgi:uncharacterized protein YggE